MINYYQKGVDLRIQIKELVFLYMTSNPNCAKNEVGLRTTDIFRDCGLDWGDYENVPSTRQQHYVVALLRELESEGKIQRDEITKKWRLK